MESIGGHFPVSTPSLPARRNVSKNMSENSVRLSDVAQIAFVPRCAAGVFAIHSAADANLYAEHAGGPPCHSLLPERP
jgi:hypothetical protein